MSNLNPSFWKKYEAMQVDLTVEPRTPEEVRQRRLHLYGKQIGFARTSNPSRLDREIQSQLTHLADVEDRLLSPRN